MGIHGQSISMVVNYLLLIDLSKLTILFLDMKVCVFVSVCLSACLWYVYMCVRASKGHKRAPDSLELKLDYKKVPDKSSECYLQLHMVKLEPLLC